MTDTPLRILSLDVENILRVVAVHIEPNGRVVELTGRNRQGKSSVIEALWAALGGEKMIPPDPIHDGADQGRVLVAIGDDAGVKLRVTRKIKKAENEKGFATSLTIEGEDGARFQNPQQILNKLIGSLSCDPLDFIAMKPDAQFDLLKQFVPGVDFAAIAAAAKKDFDERTDVNRQAKAARTRADAVSLADAPASGRVDEAALVAALAGAAEKNGAVERFRSAQANRKAQSDAFDTAAEDQRKRITELQGEIERLTAAADQNETNAANLRLEISDAGDEPPTVDTTALQVRITSARDHNARVDAHERARTEKDRLAKEALGLEQRSSALTKAMEERETAKEAAIAAAKMPVPGLGFGDGVIMLDGHPLSQASQAQKLGVAIAIAVALQPRLRFVTTKNAALLDEESWAALVALAEKQDLLVIAETVNSNRPTAVVIEDGHVRGAAQKQAAE
jgi:hypothetical protein